MHKQLSLAGILLALSTVSHSQTAITFEECSRAVEAVERYVNATRQMTHMQLSEQEISLTKHAAVIASLDEYSSTYTLNNCMSGEHTNVYQCFATFKGDLAICR